MDGLISIYIKVNILMMFSFLIWLMTKKLAGVSRLDVGQSLQLSIARSLFLGVIACATFLLAFNTVSPELTSGVMSVLPEAGDLSIGNELSAGLAGTFELGGIQIHLGLMISLLLIVGIAIKGWRLLQQWAQLKKVIDNSTLLKSINGVQILFSSQISTPFSTRALGQKHVILPYQLLGAPQNMRIAIKHELQHLRNGDLNWVLFIELIKLLCFWNPAAYAWHNEFDCLQEFACDEVLVKKRNINSASYGNCLLEVATNVSGQLFLASSNMVPTFSFFRKAQSQLKRRIVMMSNLHIQKFTKLKSGFYVVLFSVALVACSSTVLNESDTKRPEFMPLVTVPPKYPAIALENDLRGWVQISFTVDEVGEVKNPFVLKSCVANNIEALVSNPQKCDEDSSILNSVSLDAIMKFKFEPRLENGRAIKTDGVQYVFSFALDNDERFFPQR